MENRISVIDEPAPLDHDDLDTTFHSRALIRFIEKTGTPMTIAIQGEWGSGKTSLLNTICHHFESYNNVKQIWINAWEHSLLCKPEEALIKVINTIISELISSDTDKARIEKIKNNAKMLFSSALRIGTSMTLGAEASSVARELTCSKDVSIASLRKDLDELVQEIAERSTNPYKKLLIYVDDLDRIEPKNAVIILELLKNIFNISNSVFVLAIDYQVVVKGLEEKFGKHNEENEWEFRAFFDKIIQLPFMMPMGQYNIGKYVNTLLKSVGFIEQDMSSDDIREVVYPRAIKRLVNSVSLIQIFSEEKAKDRDAEESDLSDKEEKFLLFAILCLQIAYPSIYELLTEEPNFPQWDEKFAFRQTRGLEEKDTSFASEFKNAINTDDFNEEWEQSLFRICYPKPRIRKYAVELSKFFSFIKEEFFAGREEIIQDSLNSVLSKTTVTSIGSTTNSQMTIPERNGAYKRRYLGGLDQWCNLYESQGLSKDLLEVARDIYKYLLTIDDEVDIVFTDSFTAKINKHKFLGVWGITRKRTNTEYLGILILKHYKRDYRFPGHDQINISEVLKHFTENSLHQKGEARAAEWIHFRLNLEQYKILKPWILRMIQESYDMAKHHWDKRLRINNGERTFQSFEHAVCGKVDQEKYVDLCKKYINPEHVYDLETSEDII